MSLKDYAQRENSSISDFEDTETITTPDKDIHKVRILSNGKKGVKRRNQSVLKSPSHASCDKTVKHTLQTLHTKVTSMEHIIGGIQDGYIHFMNSIEEKLAENEKMMTDISVRCASVMSKLDLFNESINTKQNLMKEVKQDDLDQMKHYINESNHDVVRRISIVRQDIDTLQHKISRKIL